jgi:hypothetical protein
MCLYQICEQVCYSEMVKILIESHREFIYYKKQFLNLKVMFDLASLQLLLNGQIFVCFLAFSNNEHLGFTPNLFLLSNSFI